METIHQERKDVILIEGILILEDERLRDLMDIKVYLQTMKYSYYSPY